MARSAWVAPTVFLLGVLMGTCTTLFSKIIYNLEAVGISGELQKFEKPLTTTWVMFIAMSLAMPAHWIITFNENRNRKGPAPPGIEWLTYFKLIIPACFDLMGTALSGIGLLFTTVSVYQLMRCSVIIVTAILKTTFLKQSLSRYMWVGIGINTIAMLLVSSTAFSPSEADVSANGGRDPKIGIFFILLSCIVQGSQYIFEEKVMAVDSAPPLVVVGMEGVWGMLLMPAVVFPWAYILPGSDVGGCIENIFDAYVMCMNSRSIQIVLALFTLTVFFYNIFCIYVTALLSAIWHAILDNFRPVSVWATDLALFYIFTRGAFGEAWTVWSWLELAGMLLLFFGTAVYNGTVKLPGFEYPQLEGDLDSHGLPPAPGTPRLRTPSTLSSPSLTSSPLLNRSISRASHTHSPSHHAHSEYNSLNTVQPSNYGSSNTHNQPLKNSSRNTAKQNNNDARV